jgi:hypothetical protein
VGEPGLGVGPGLDPGPAPDEGRGVGAPSAASGSAAGDTLLIGRLLLGGSPADTGTVVLHRVTPEEAGALDSIRVGRGGDFELALPGPPVPGSGEIFFASHRREGLLYFGRPVTDPVQLDSLYLIESYDTRPAPEDGQGLPFQIHVRNLFIDQGPMGWRVTDLFEIRNDSAVTWVPGPDDRPVWRYPLPPEGLSFRATQGDLEPGALRFVDGGVELHAAVPPGERLYVVQYDVETLELSLPLPGSTEILELLVEEPAPPLRIDGLVPDRPAELEPGRTYLRWTGVDLADARVRVSRGEEGTAQLLPWIGVALAVLLFGAGLWAVRGRPAPAPVGGHTNRAGVLLAVARLDEEFEALGNPSPEQEARYRERRGRLLARLGGASPESGGGVQPSSGGEPKPGSAGELQPGTGGDRS